MARQCAFCPQAASLNGEHLWSAWIGRELGSRIFRMVHKEADGSTKTWMEPELSSKAKVVCGPCNSGWMSRLEKKAKAVIKDMIVRGTPTILQTRDLETIAAFAFVKAVVADHMHKHRLPFLTLGECQSFSKTLEIPPGVQMWLGSMADSSSGSFKSHYFETTANTSRDFKLQAFTYGIGHLVIQVVVFRWKKKLFKRQKSYLPLTQNQIWDSVSIPFWPPPQTDVKWPPPKPMSHALLETFVLRWAKLARAAA